jgi:ubiquinone/menaquinone biosynthesis C-methylase UbiE
MNARRSRSIAGLTSLIGAGLRQRGEVSPPAPRMAHDEAILELQRDPKWAQHVLDNYHDRDVLAAARRFAASAEFAEVAMLLGGIRDRVILEVGAGSGIGSYAFAQSGARAVYAIEPDDSPLVGRRAMRTVIEGLPVHLIGGIGEALPLPDACVDVAYCRATLHHVRDLDRVLADCARALRSGGTFLACREPVADDAGQLRTFLASHPVHQMAGGEHAFRLEQYVGAITRAGLQVERVFGPWDSVINSFPTVQNNEELHDLIGTKLRRRLGPLRALAVPLRLLEPAFAAWVKRPTPGRSYSFLARKL